MAKRPKRPTKILCMGMPVHVVWSKTRPAWALANSEACFEATTTPPRIWVSTHQPDHVQAINLWHELVHLMIHMANLRFQHGGMEEHFAYALSPLIVSLIQANPGLILLTAHGIPPVYTHQKPRRTR